jgi:hypothetical protein
MKDAIEVSTMFHEGNRMMAVPKQPAPVPLTDEQISAIGSKIFPSTWNPRHVEFARAILAAAQRQWVGLTDEDYHTNMFSITSLSACDIATIKSIAKDVEAKLKEKNT